ncbi:MAG: hypothetical protein QOE28_85 [Solirubrobacteraceae bacterium]|jgi:hypothetical protein|nr:hypothetical protein [Solirubrobacteraceae bacterium]
MRVGIVPNPRGKGLAPSLGAGGSLIVAGLCCLLAVSAMLAFRGWPGTDRGHSDGHLSLRAPAAKPAAARDVAAPVVAAAPSRTATRPAWRSRRAAAHRRRAVRGPTAPTPGASVPVGAPAPASSRSAAAPSGSGSGSAAPARPAAPGPVERIVTTGQNLVAPVTNALPPAVQQVTQPVTGTVQNAAKTIDGTLPPLPALP